MTDSEKKKKTIPISKIKSVLKYKIGLGVERKGGREHSFRKVATLT